MKQILHIFRKDTRHLWLEIVASIAITVALVLVYPLRWRLATNDIRYREMTYVASFLFLLVPLTWWLLTARLIQDEGLVGENQFWLTRPYEWKRLLAAKALFLMGWLYLPFMLAQAALVVEAGLHPLGHASEWLNLVLLDSGIAIVPLVALATVTANFARMTLTLLGSILAVVAAMVLFEMGSTGYEAMVPHPHRMVSFVLVAVLGCAAIMLQYATRKVWLTRGLLIATLVLAFAAPICMYARRDSTIDRAYPATGNAVQLAWGPHHLPGLQSSERPRMVYVTLPLQFSGVAEGQAVQLDDVRFSIDAPDGSHWSAPWWTAQRQRLLPGARVATVQIMMPRDVYDRYQSAPITMHVALAVTKLDAGTPVNTAIESHDLAVPGFGVCSIDRRQELLCRIALGDPQLTYIKAAWSTEPCVSGQAGVPAAFGVDWGGTAYQDPVEFGPLAVAQTFAFLWPRTSEGYTMQQLRGITLCPGAPITSTQYNVIGRSQADLTVPNLQLPPDTLR